MKNLIGNVQFFALLLPLLFASPVSYGQINYIEVDSTTSYTEYDVKEEDPCAKDTTIIFRQGTRVTLNRCEYLNLKSCFGVAEYNLDTALQKGELNTITDDRKPLYSGGMADIQFCGECLEKPAIVQIPVSKECAPCRMSLWTGTSEGDWLPEKPPVVKTVRIGGVDYYEFKVKCAGPKNVACLGPIADEIKFVMRDNELMLKEIRISYGCPNGMYNAVRSRGAKSIEMNLPCPSGDPMIYAVAFTEAGDTLVMPYQPLNDLTRSNPITTCRAILKKDRKSKDKNVLYEKYILFRRDFESRPTVQAE